MASRANRSLFINEQKKNGLKKYFDQETKYMRKSPKTVDKGI